MDLFREKGKENANYCIIIGYILELYRVNAEKKMETTITGLYKD